MVFQREVEETCGEHPGGVLSVSKVTENPDGILVYLKRAKQKLEAESGNMKSHWTGIFTAKVYLKRQQTQFVADIRKTLGEM